MGRWITGLFLALAVAAGAALWLQRQMAEVLRGEIAQLREEQGELTRARLENRRLVANLISEEELKRLQGDHAAVRRLREEIEKTRENLQTRERAVAKGTGETR